MKADWKSPCGTIRLYRGDSLKVVAGFKQQRVTSIVTDPPYGLGFMGKHWDHGVPGRHFWEVFARVCVPGAALLSFGGTRTYHRLACAIEDAGWELRDSLMWLYGSGFPKSHNLALSIDKKNGTPPRGKAFNMKGRGDRAVELDSNGREFLPPYSPATDEAKLWDGYGTALKPAYEPIILAMKPIEGTFADNALKHGQAGLNIDGCRIQTGASPSVERRKHAAPKESHGSTGWVTPARPPGYNEQRVGELLGRWPANILLDEQAAYQLNRQAGQDVSRFFYTAKAPKSEKNYGCDDLEPQNNMRVERSRACESDKHKTKHGNNHPTVKPLGLMRWLVRLIKCPQECLVLEPFLGSGTTAVACYKEGVSCIGLEREDQYFEIAVARMEAAVKRRKRLGGFFQDEG